METLVSSYLLDPSEWASQNSAHFRVYFRTRSAAQRNAALVLSRLEHVRAAFGEAVCAGDAKVLPALINVYLTETLDDETEEDGPGPVTGGVAPRIVAVYRSDAPGQGLERALVEALLAHVAGERAAQSPFLVDGLVGVLAENVARGLVPRSASPSGGQAPALLDNLPEGMAVGTGSLLAGPTEENRTIYSRAAASLVKYLISTGGSERFREFARSLGAGGAGPAAEAVYKRSWPLIEKEWQGSLHKAGPQLIGTLGFFRHVSRLFLAHPCLAALAFVSTTPFVAFKVFQPLILKEIIDRSLARQDIQAVVYFIGILAALLILKSAGTVAKDYCVARLTSTTMNELRARTLSHLQRLSQDFYARSQAGDLVSRFSTDLDALEQSAGHGFFVIVQQGLLFLAAFIALFAQDVRIGAVVLVLFLVMYAGFRLVGPRAERAAFEHQQHSAHALSTVTEYILTHPVVRAFGLHQRTLQRFRDQLAGLLRSALRVSLLSGYLEGITVGGGGVLIVAATALGAVLVLAKELTVGGLAAINGLVQYVVAPVELISKEIHSIHHGTGAMRRIDELLAEQPEVQDAPGARPLTPLSREIRFEDVTFSYTGAQANLDRISLAIPAGQSVAIVGPSGCGKSTLLKLIMRSYHPTLGRVTVDGHDLRMVTEESLLDQIGMVFQECILFDTSIRENIRAGRPAATDAEVEAAARAAEIHDFIAGLPQGYDTRGGERGGRLSAGQRQRIAIARAIVRQPALLLLDEATSALDPEAEAQVTATLNRLAKGRTVISVTHRLAAAAQASRIIVLDRGTVAEEGAHSGLVKAGGLYQRLWDQQESLRDGLAELAESISMMERLRAIPIFRSLDESVLSPLTGKLATESYGAGETVFAEGDPADKLFIIVKGRVEVLATGPAGGLDLLTELRDGDHFGEMALRRDLPRTTTVRTAAPSIFLSLERQSILKSAADILLLPEAERRLAGWVTRRGQATAAEAAKAFSLSEEDARGLLDRLVASGYLQDAEEDGGGQLYSLRLRRKQASRLSDDIWKALT